jgi:hypothetical protein
VSQQRALCFTANDRLPPTTLPHDTGAVGSKSRLAYDAQSGGPCPMGTGDDALGDEVQHKPRPSVWATE